ncbi:Na+-driven multidrug efflux pump [Halovivax ruber XH-70]|uniref:Na+-driven multidrug efflux pump n=1 Tax=Halovivax ruber (strain DSM 18193 / JCM 13892 / XH-70) TaxID=797302 RepID=L0IAA2_HALRX|nr:MATE family efflux transporter [Halovivax ruber]AGB15171.1 Na+-driven multidrug efflux pump [Halovivax ruber XH-70]
MTDSDDSDPTDAPSDRPESPDSSSDDGRPAPADSRQTGPSGEAPADAANGAAGETAGPDADAGAGGSDPASSSITEGSLVKPLFHLAWPIVVIQLLQVTYNVADTLWLGRLSTESVGAISLAFPLIFLMIAIAGGFTTAGAILVAQYTGARGERSSGLVAGQTLSFVMLLSVVIAIVGYFYTRPALSILPSDPDTKATVIPLAADYMEVFFLGLPLVGGFFVFSALMRGYGDTRTPMLVMVVSVVVNVVADPFLIFGFADNPLFGMLAGVPVLGTIDFLALEATLYELTGFTGWGIEGAALATIGARAVATAVGVYVLFATSRGPDIETSHLVPDLDVIRDIVRLGTPSMVEQAMSAMAMITLTAMIVTFAPPVVTAFGLGNRLISLVFLPAMGLGRAIDTMVGQNLGADRADRAARAVTLAASTGAGVMLLVAVVALAFTEPIVSVFIGPDVQDAAIVEALGVEYVRTRTVEFAFIGVSQVVLGGFRGAGNTRTAMVISMLTLWVGRVVSVFVLAFNWSVTVPVVGITISAFGLGATGIWIGMALGNVVGALVGVAWFSRGTWREKYIDDPGEPDSGSGQPAAVSAGDE